MRVHVVWCAGCGRAWLDNGAGLSTCSCTCADPADPDYERWLTEDLPPVPAVQAAWGLLGSLARGVLSLN